jgi:SHS family sialic acid transporter-like MFS transporter
MLAGGAAGVIVLILVIHDFVLAEVVAFVSGALLIGAAGIWGSILTENLPTEVRATGVGFLYNFGSFGGGLAPFLVLSAIGYFQLGFGSGLALATVFAAGLSIFVLRFARETRGVALSDAGGSSSSPGAGASGYQRAR